MDPPPPLPPHPTTIAAVSAATNHLNQNYPDSIDSSPRSRHTETWDDPLPPFPGAKLRLMCSYGGHIIPRPHDKSLCYVGGDTRIIVADRHSALSDLCARLSRTLLHGRHFTLKYQLPNEELDSLVSITTDEDLENMIEEYDRLTSACSSLKPARLRLFLFPSKPETAASMGSLLDDAKSETWFVDALNGTGLLPRGLSDSATMDNLLELDDGIVHVNVNVNANANANANVNHTDQSQADLEVPNEFPTHKMVKNLQDVHSNMPDSPVVETNSSFGSSSSSPTMSNLPPIKVRVDETGSRVYDQMAGLDEHLSQMSVAGAPPPPLPVIIGGGQTMVTSGMGNSNVCHNEHLSRVLSDDERSDHGAPSGFRKPPLPLQPVPRKIGHDPYNLPSPDSKHTGGYNLPSPESVTSDCSMTSATSFAKQAQYQDPTQVATRETRAPSPQIYPITNFPDHLPTSVQEAMYNQTQHQNQQPQQFYHNTHYIHHPGTPNPVPISSYYPVYATTTTQPPPPHHQQMEPPQYQMYYMPVPQNQTYNHAMQSDSTTNPPIAAATPPLYPTKTSPPPATAKTPEMMSNTPYRTVTPTLIQIPPNQYQQQYLNIPPTPHYPPTQGYEYSQQTHEQVNYYPQHSVSAVPSNSQYQTMTSATAAMLSQASAQQQQQQAAENAKQQIGTSQQL